MGSPRALGVAVAGILLFAGCGEVNDPSADAGTTAGQASTVTLPPPLDTIDGVDPSRALRVGCAGWSFEENRDSSAINDAVYDFLQGDVNLAPTREQATIDAAVGRACDESGGDPASAVQILMEELDIDHDELTSMVTDACLRYGRGRETPDPTFDRLTAMVMGMSDDELAAMVLEICGDEVFVDEPEPQILPDLLLTPGQAGAGDDLDTWCADGFAESVPPPDPANVEAVLTSYRVAPADSGGFVMLRLIPARLGGTDDPSNLFPVQIDAHPGAADKPVVDDRVVELVCAGDLDAALARAEIVSGWPSAYASVSARDDGTPTVSISERVSTEEDTG